MPSTTLTGSWSLPERPPAPARAAVVSPGPGQPARASGGVAGRQHARASSGIQCTAPERVRAGGKRVHHSGSESGEIAGSAPDRSERDRSCWRGLRGIGRHRTVTRALRRPPGRVARCSSSARFVHRRDERIGRRTYLELKAASPALRLATYPDERSLVGTEERRSRPGSYVAGASGSRRRGTGSSVRPLRRRRRPPASRPDRMGSVLVLVTTQDVVRWCSRLAT